MENLFSELSRAVEGAPAVALAASLLWGVLSMILSPCHLASIPLIVGFISGQGKVSGRRSFALASVFALGILITIAIVGAITALAGRMAGDLGSWSNYFVAAVLVLVGLNMLGVIPMPWRGPRQIESRRQGWIAAFVLGLVFGTALGPCTFAFMAPMLAAGFKVARTAPLHAAGLLFAYAIGHCSIIVLAGSSVNGVQRLLDWNEQSKGLTILKGVCGVLVVIGGLYLIYAAR